MTPAEASEASGAIVGLLVSSLLTLGTWVLGLPGWVAPVVLGGLAGVVFVGKVILTGRVNKGAEPPCPAQRNH